jgi:hypothetical protein
VIPNPHALYRKGVRVQAKTGAEDLFFSPFSLLVLWKKAYSGDAMRGSSTNQCLRVNIS